VLVQRVINAMSSSVISIVLTYMNTSLTGTSVVFTRILGQRICQHRFRFRIKGVYSRKRPDIVFD
jgi:hypothetical protein